MANYFNTLNLRQQLDQLGRCRFMSWDAASSTRRSSSPCCATPTPRSCWKPRRRTTRSWIDSALDKNWWKNDVKLTGGKLFNEIHELDLLCWFLGDITSVYAQSTNRAHPDNLENHDIIQLLLQFKSGVFASLEMGTAYRLHEWGISIHGERGALVINFYNSTMTLTLSDGTRQQFNLYDEFEADL